MNSILLKIFLLLSGVLLLIGCGGGSGDDVVEVNYEVPELTDDGWKVSSASEVGIKETELTKLAKSLETNQYPGTDSFLVVKDGLLIQELYFNNFNRDKVHDLRSATKSITSALVGIAIDQGAIEGVNKPVFPSFVNEYSDIDEWVDGKNDITIKHLLTMTSGLSCDDNNVFSPGNEDVMYGYRDWVKFILDLPLISEPGSKWAYCTGGVVSLGAMIEDSTGIQTENFASSYLFEPLGIRNYHWEFTPTGRVDTGGHIHMTPRDMAKIGQLFLQKGLWNEQSLISKKWILESTSGQVTNGEGYFYGYLWWRALMNDTHVFYYARGNGGQFITIIPHLELVVVSTGNNYGSNVSSQFFNMLKIVVDAIQ
jgi:CubicO group peptidase (beta-lactamase class C family)